MVWKNGKLLGKPPELSSLFIVTPPPIAPFLSPPSQPKEKIKKEPRKILGLSKNNFFMVCGALIVLAGITVSNTLQENRSRELQLKNHKTEVENYQLELKQKEAEDEKIQAVMQEKIEAERADKEKKLLDSTRLLEINKLVAQSQIQLDLAKKDLNNTSGFKLFRDASEKKEQMDLLQNTIDSIKNEISQLNKESNQLKLKLEKITK